MALKRRDTAELIAEELRRLDPDDTYASALRFGVERLNASAAAPETRTREAVAPSGAGRGAGCGLDRIFGRHITRAGQPRQIRAPPFAQLTCWARFSLLNSLESDHRISTKG